MNFSRIVRILFPEIQLFDFVRQHGFVNRSKTTDMTAVSETAPVNISGGASYLQSGTSCGCSGGSCSDSSSSGISLNSRENLDAAINKKKTENRYVASAKKDYEDVFDKIYQEMKKVIYEQDNFLKSLIVGFKLPFIVSKKGEVWNSVLLAGPAGTGKNYALSLLVHLMYEYDIILYKRPYFFNAARYNEKEVESNFINDISKCFSDGVGVVCFRGWEKAVPQIREYITGLFKEGFFRTPSGTIVKADDYFLVLYLDFPVKEKGPYEQIPSSLNDSITKFRPYLKSWAITEKLSEKSLEKILSEKIQILIDEFFKEFGINISAKDDFIRKLSENLCKEKRGGEAIDEWVQNTCRDKLQVLLAEGNLPKKTAASFFWNEEGAFIKTVKGQWPLIALSSGKKETVEDIMKELNAFIGLKSIKDEIAELIATAKLQKEKEEAGIKTGVLTLHLAFTGNPGTGKTTIARIISRLYKALGFLKSGHTVEVSRQDMVAGYVGHTAPQTIAKVKEALGGVLFIDEAYTLYQDKEDVFGREAIDALLKAMEDHRSELAVIVAGYSNLMKDFLDSNPGMRSRIPNILEFPDYTPEEMLGILKLIAGKRYHFSDETAKGLLELFEKRQIPGRNDSGNGRLVRNVLDEAVKKQNLRLSKMDKKDENDYRMLLSEDFGLGERKVFNIESAFAGVIGLEVVKAEIRALKNLVSISQKKKELGLICDIGQRLNMIFSGNPGTGKTMMARLVAEMLKDIGILKKGHLTEVTRKDLVGEYLGHTAIKTAKVIQDALGGVLFIDEAYQLNEEGIQGGGFGKEAVDTLIREVENNKDNIVVILAGYKNEMADLLKINPGLLSRFPIHIHFPDYSAEEMFQITEIISRKKGLLVAPNVREPLIELFEEKQIPGKNDSGNGRLVDNLIDKAMRNQSTRLQTVQFDKFSEDEQKKILQELTLSDFEIKEKQKEDSALDELKNIIGLDSIKEFVAELSDQIEMRRLKEKRGIKVGGDQSLHMVFTGNPGTGKTTIARIIAKRLKEIGVIKKDEIVETDRSGLVAGYVGQTAMKTLDKIHDALGGVLFIDEAYALADESPGGFGKEAIDTIVKAMEDYRNELIIILAGYENDMNRFLDSNEGLRSRFPNIIKFPDYSLDELTRIALKILDKHGWHLAEGLESKLVEIIADKMKSDDFGNGRGVRNLIEKLERKADSRLLELNKEGVDLDKDVITTIILEDLEEID